MKILVTGAFGFLGGRVSQYFLSEGHEVLLGTRQPVAPGDCRLESGRVVQMSWTNSRNLEEACAGVDVIIHASGMNAQDCASDPVGALNVNTVATANLLYAAIKNKVRRFIYISTVHVYTDILHGVISESICPCNIHPYASSTRAAEDVVLYAQKQGLIDGIVIRLANGYGVPIHRSVNCWMLLVNNLCRQAVEIEQLRLSSDGSQIRNFIPMQEICAVIDFVACRISFRRNIGEMGPINVGSRSSLSVLDMARAVQARCSRVLNFNPEVVVNARQGRPLTLQLDFQIQRLLSLGYEFLHDPSNEIDCLLRYCQSEFPRT